MVHGAECGSFNDNDFIDNNFTIIINYNTFIITNDNDKITISKFTTPE